MKKAASILLICIYSLASMGFSIKQFYCCGNLKSTTLSIVKDEKQQCNNGTSKSGCCDNIYQFFKVKDNHITAGDISSPVKQIIDLLIFTPLFQEISLASQINTIAYKSNAPPLHKSLPIYLYNCVFII